MVPGCVTGVAYESVKAVALFGNEAISGLQWHNVLLATNQPLGEPADLVQMVCATLSCIRDLAVLWERMTDDPPVASASDWPNLPGTGQESHDGRTAEWHCNPTAGCIPVNG